MIYSGLYKTMISQAKEIRFFNLSEFFFSAPNWSSQATMILVQIFDSLILEKILPVGCLIKSDSVLVSSK